MKRSELESLPTKQLLARLKQLQQCENSALLSDRENYQPSEFIEFKDTKIWQTEYDKLKEISGNREHIPSKK